MNASISKATGFWKQTCFRINQNIYFSPKSSQLEQGFRAPSRCQTLCWAFGCTGTWPDIISSSIKSVKPTITNTQFLVLLNPWCPAKFLSKRWKAESLHPHRNWARNTKSNSCFLFYRPNTNGLAEVCFCKNKYSVTKNCRVFDKFLQLY